MSSALVVAGRSLSQGGRPICPPVTRPSVVHPIGLSGSIRRGCSGRTRIGYGDSCPIGTTVRAISSAGERFVHTEEVTGSIPVSPTVFSQVRGVLGVVAPLTRQHPPHHGEPGAYSPAPQNCAPGAEGLGGGWTFRDRHIGSRCSR